MRFSDEELTVIGGRLRLGAPCPPLDTDEAWRAWRLGDQSLVTEPVPVPREELVAWLEVS